MNSISLEHSTITGLKITEEQQFKRWSMGTAAPPFLGKARVLVRPSVELPSCTDYFTSWSLSSSYRTSLWRSKNRKNQHSWQWRSLSPLIQTQLEHATKTSHMPRIVDFNNLISHPAAQVEQDCLNAVTAQVRLPSETVLSLGYKHNMNPTYSPSSLGPDAERVITFNNSGSVIVRENVRRAKISRANKGKVPWNKGKPHSAETIERIRERTKVAMRNPQVRKKLQHFGENRSSETKAKIREKMTGLWETRKKIKIAQDNCVKYWKEVVANAARLGGLGEERLEWGTSEKIKAKWRSEGLALVRQEKERLLERQKAEARVRRSLGCSDAHRRAISDSIKAKWADPKYRTRVSAGMQKVDPERRRPRASEMQEADLQISDLPVETMKIGQKAPIDEEFVAEVLAENVTAKVRSARSTAARIRGPQKVTLARPGVQVDLSAATREDSLSDIQDIEQKKGVVLPEKGNLLTQKQIAGQGPDCNLSGAQAPLHVTYKDPLVNEKLRKIRLLREGRLLLELKRKEAADRARMLIADAERAARSLERVAETDRITMASLIETRRLLAEATRSMQTADGCWAQRTPYLDLPPKINNRASSGSQNPPPQTREEAEDLAATTGHTNFHSRLWTTGHEMAQCPHPIPLRGSQFRPFWSVSTAEEQLDATTSNAANEHSAQHHPDIEARSSGSRVSNQPNISSEIPLNDSDSDIRPGPGRENANDERSLASLHGASGSSPVLERVLVSGNEKLENSPNKRERFVPSKSRGVKKKWHRGRLVAVDDSNES